MPNAIALRNLIFAAAFWLAAANPTHAQSPGGTTATSIIAGPVYTSPQGSSSGRPASPPAIPVPVYPIFDVVVPIDPKLGSAALSPSGWEETEPGRSSPVTATAVRAFGQTGYGLSLVLALDASGSMRGRSMNTIRASVAKFVDQAGPHDLVAVMTFADEARWEVPFPTQSRTVTGTARSAEVRRAIGDLAPRGHQTRLYDAMLAAVDRFDDSMPKRRVLIVISDGHDEGSMHSLQDVIAEAKARAIAVHAIGVTHSDERYLESLKSVAAATGGTYAEARSDEEMDRLLGNGVEALKQTPVVTFTTLRNDAPTLMVPISIRWRPGNLTATAKLSTMPIPGSILPDKRRKWFAGLIVLLVAALIAFLALRRRQQTSTAALKAAVPQSPSAHVPQADTPAPPPLAPEPGQGPRRIPPHDLPGWQPDPGLAPTPPAQATIPRSPRYTRLAVAFPASPHRSIAMLQAFAGPLSGTTVAIDRSPFTIGAAADNYLAIDGDPTLSGHHASLCLESSILFLDDLDSRNGTYINGVKLAASRRSLAPGDELRLGRSLFRVVHPPG